MKKYSIFLLLTMLFSELLCDAQEWKPYEVNNTMYNIFYSNFNYSDTAFLITDTRADSAYHSIESYNIKTLNVFRPHNGNDFLDNRPVIFFVHGGAWTDGYAHWYNFISKAFTGDMGWVVVNIDYRLTSDSVFLADQYCPDREHCGDTINRSKAAWYPDNINDVAEAFSWTTKNISQWGGDTNNIFVFGHSAGGHLVSLLSVKTEFEPLRDRIRGAISLSGAYSIPALSEIVFKGAIEETFLGGYTNNAAELNEASPISYVSSGGLSLPPFQLLHCSMDLPSLPENKILFENMLDLYGHHKESFFLNGYSHVTEMTAIEEVTEVPTSLIIDFVERNRYTSINENSNNMHQKLSMEIAPNPFTNQLSITVVNRDMAKINVEVLDIHGRFIRQLFCHLTEGETQIFVWDGQNENGSEIMKGIYLIRVKSTSCSLIRQVVKQ